jgi:hypothetical protein
MAKKGETRALQVIIAKRTVWKVTHFSTHTSTGCTALYPDVRCPCGEVTIRWETPLDEAWTLDASVQRERRRQATLQEHRTEVSHGEEAWSLL